MFPNWWRRWESNPRPQHRKLSLSKLLSLASTMYFDLTIIVPCRSLVCFSCIYRNLTVIVVRTRYGSLGILGHSLRNRLRGYYSSHLFSTHISLLLGSRQSEERLVFVLILVGIQLPKSRQEDLRKVRTFPSDVVSYVSH